jgi:fluoroquinolone transport system ATP-binding protein
MLSVQNLHFTYPKAAKEAINGISFELQEGEIFGFLGPSGAGKSTTQKILIGLLKGYHGKVSVLGRELSSWGQDYYEQIGVSFELPNHYLKLTALENLNYFRSLYSGKTREAMQVLALVGLEEDAHKKVSDFSKGMKIRLNVARSLLHQPKLLFLDEPTAGLDPVNSRKMKDMLLAERQAGTSIFITTHDMWLADELCDRVAFLSSGKISAMDSPVALKKQYGKRNVQIDYLNGTSAIQNREFSLDGLGNNSDFLKLLQHASRIEAIHSQETTLDKIFIQVTGQELGQ